MPECSWVKCGPQIAHGCAWLHMVVGSLQFDAVVRRNWKSLDHSRACFNII